ncbi:hypothetical protein ACWCXH_07180 [Kitasatospora sp. NPDC001660]
MPSRIRVGRDGGRRGAGLAVFAGFVLTVGLALTGCDPSAADGGAKASASPSPTAAVSMPAAAAPTTTPSAAGPTAAAPQPSVPPATHSQAPAGKPSASKAPQPQPKVTTAQPPTDPGPQQTAAAGGGCEIRSNAGNCYAAGQFCRDADLGRSTHDADGRVITCRMVSGKPHWQA